MQITVSVLLLSVAYFIYIDLISSRRLSGLAEGVSSVIQCAVRQEWSSITGCSSLTQFEPRYCSSLTQFKSWYHCAMLSVNTNYLHQFINLLWIYIRSYCFFLLFTQCIYINKHLFSMLCYKQFFSNVSSY